MRLVSRLLFVFGGFGPRATLGTPPLFADEVRPCSIYGAVFWMLRNHWHLAFNIFDAVMTHTVVGGYTRPISYTPKSTSSQHARYTAKPPGTIHRENRRLCLSAPNDGTAARVVGAVGTDNAERSSLGPTPLSYTRVAAVIRVLLLWSDDFSHASGLTLAQFINCSRNAEDR